MITQPENATACVGGTAMFTCVMDIHNINISAKDVYWWRIRTDNNNPYPLILKHCFPRLNISTSINGHRLTSILIIYDVTSVFNGPYWLGLFSTEGSSDKAYLSITANGMHEHIR